jgi:hypothetical protein
VSGKSGGEGAILLVAAYSQDLVQGAPRESAARQCPIDRRDTKGQHSMRHRRRPLDPPDALTKLGKKSPCCIEHVPSLFLRTLLSRPALDDAAFQKHHSPR